MYIDDDELRDLYKTSSEEHIQAISTALMALEKNPDHKAPLEDLLRSAHTLKGDSRMLGVADVETLVHQIEECLMPISKGQRTLDSALCDRLYAGLDTIEKLAHTAVTGEPNDVDMFRVLATLMGDGDEATPVPRITPLKTLTVPPQPVNEKGLFGTDALLSEIDLMGLESINTGDDLWVGELGDLPSINPVTNTSGRVDSPLLDDFLNLAADLFPVDSTLPELDSGAVFNDFALIPGTESQADIDDFDLSLSEDLMLIPALDPNAAIDLAFAADLDFSMMSPMPVGSQTEGIFVNDLETLIEDDLFPTLDSFVSTHSIEDTIPPQFADPEPIIEPTPVAPVTKSKDIAPIPTPTTIDTIRVEARQLDTLMGQTGEISVISQQIASRLTDFEDLIELWDTGGRDHQNVQNQLKQLPEHSALHYHFNRTHQQWEQMGQLINKFKQLMGNDSSRLDLVTSALDSGVKKLRLLPLSTIFNLFPRMVRDLAKTQSKEINFSIEGGDYLLDKRLLEDIKDPLMHLLRNAIDHGLETPTEREQSGKQAAASLNIKVHQTGNQTTIEILDDGRGLDLKRIKATAIKRGLHTETELAGMTDRQIQSLIFAAGFSTRTRVTELSGRGVGLDIVKTNIERLKGSVEVDSTPGYGCIFRLQLSHSIGSSQVMMVDVRDRLYALPMEYVDRMLLLDKADIFALGGTPTTTINGKTVTVAWLADLLAIPMTAPASPDAAKRTTNAVTCLLLQSGQQQLALLVDGIRDRQIVTIEAPHPILKNVPHLSGSTILGTGEVCLVLNPPDLFQTATGGNPLSVAPKLPTAMPTETPPTLLLVEDSLVIRTQMQRILKGAGYQVTVAVDGLEGWEKLQAGQFDLVISDVEMPRWSGLDLTTHIRKQAEYEDLPVILVTTLAQAEDRDRGLQAGANAYLTKGDFDQQLLLDTLTRLI